LEPGRATLFLLSDYPDADYFAEALRPQHPPVIKTTLPDNPDAKRAVDWLWNRDSPSNAFRLSGVACVRWRRCLGWMTTGRAALIGAGQGALIGLIRHSALAYLRAVRNSPGVVLAHRDVVAALEVEPPTR